MLRDAGFLETVITKTSTCYHNEVTGGRRREIEKRSHFYSFEDHFKKV